MGRVQGKVALVTGAGMGLGRAAAELLAREGARIAVTDIDSAGGEETVRLIERAGGEAFFQQHDVADEAAWRRVMTGVEERFGRLDVLVNNAGIAIAKNVEETTFAEWRRTMAVNADGVFLGCREAIPLMRRSGSGSIINLSSIDGIIGEADLAAYCASKGAVRTLTKAVAVHCAEKRTGIRCNSIHPGYIWTAQTENYLRDLGRLEEERAKALSRHPIGFLGEPNDIAYMVLYLASDESKFVTGAEMVVDGGYLMVCTMSTLSGRTAVITGGLTGQGLAIAEELARQGAAVAVGSFLGAARGRENDAAAYPEAREAQEVRERLKRHGTRVFAGHLDVRDTEAIRSFLRDAETACGPADILINAAGTTAEQPVCGHSDELWLKILDTNLTGAFRMIREVLPGMIERRWGRIINIGSTAASVGWKDNPAYCASKSGLLGLTRCVALEGTPHGVTCVMISPTWVETELMRRNVEQVVAREGKGRTLADAMADIARQNPQQRIIQPGEIAALAAFLCTEGAKGITMENIQVTGGALW